MPRILGLNIIAVLVAAIGMFFVGFVFYGLLFTSQWVALWGFSEADLAAMAEAGNMPMIFGFLISLATAFFIGLALKALKANDLMPAVINSVFLWAGFAVTTLAYDIVYAAQPFALLALDGAHLLVGFILAAVILTAMDGVLVKD
jgi:hypothetical protein